ncbi:MAG: hypothetical protein UR15_C0028G0007 [Parcubacteria group bacterium GW2011_GWA2_31_28]|nr:MAG: hypothetical protein UR15_C0028G0007 [Parcubacteria group bacterium GW2011_GWA2_31_28]
MKETLLIGFLLVSILILAGCEQVDISKLDLSKINPDDLNKLVICNKPYIRVGTECCVDKDDNNICDNDEIGIKKEYPGLDCTTCPQIVEKTTEKCQECELDCTTCPPIVRYVNITGNCPEIKKCPVCELDCTTCPPIIKYEKITEECPKCELDCSLCQ